MKKIISVLILTCILAVPAFAEEYDLTAKDPQVLSSIKLKKMTRKELRKAYRALLDTYTDLYNTYYEIEQEAEAPADTADETVMQEVYTASVSLNIRKEPSTDSEILGRFEPGEIVDVVSISDGWAQINYHDQTAYVSAQYIAQTTVPVSQAASTDQSGIAVPGSCADFAGRYSWDAVDALRHAGFTSIEEVYEDTELSGDLPFGLLTETGDVKEVSIDGRTDYKKGERFPADSTVTVISYRIIEPSSEETAEAEEALTESISEASAN